ncbi:citrate/2-methylcitrate synthase [Agrobacterium bohemicum]|uniref:citrate synthase (unknown stereospecificity) n=1 Tax=Agrobacterium bohemicum TaxID=2052828 RepID=A0A135P0T1_9HYPH|nr:citrate/2-methylcitrate synthase [Agrobacterium bohemicum]KXG85014.1 citrate synthase [Agrobacterium bohemicum]
MPQAASQALGISRATLYAYVSRGLVRTIAGPDDPRRRLYSKHDIDQLSRNKSVGRKPREVAATTLDWGLPVLSSSITLIEDGRLFYRGHDAAKLAEHETVEGIARLLWACGDHDPFAKPVTATWDASLLNLTAGLPLTERCQALLAFVDVGRMTAWQRNNSTLWPGAATLLRSVTAAISNSQPSALPTHLHLAKAWNLDTHSADIIRRTLVLLADHELNASAFATRVVASTGASLGACLDAGLSALSGPLHGGMTSLVEILFDEIEDAKDAADVVEKRLRRGDVLPGFEHPLYPGGDPRAAALLPLLRHNEKRQSLIGTVVETTGKLPTIDVALVSIRRELGLPIGAALALFANGRTVGWIAHALEQFEEKKLIRPRAHYAGPQPAGT